MGLPLAFGQTAAPPPAASTTPGTTKLATTAGPPAAPAAGAAVAGGVPGTAPGAAAAAEKKPRKFWIDGKFRELKKGEVRPYTAPTLPPEPEAAPSTIKVFETIKLEDGSEPQALARPYYGAPMIGTIAPGSRLAVRGEIIAKSSRYCHGKKWLALQPMGWVCAEHGKAIDQPAQTESWLRMVPGERVPFRYIMVSSSEPLPMWVSLEAFKEGLEPERMLEKGDSVAIEKIVKHEGQSYYQSVEGKILPIKGTYQMSATSQWHGLLIDEKTPLPFGWMLPETTKVYGAPGEGPPLNNLKRRTRVDILEETTIKNKRYVKIRVSAVQQSSFPIGTEPLPAPEGAPDAAKAGAPAAPAAKPAAPATATPAAAPAAAAPVVAAKPGAVPAAAVPPVAAAPAAPPAPDTFWVLAAYVNEVRLRPRPAGVTSSRWFDADLGEQVLVAYEGEKPIYATLVSSGKNNATPLGNYPVWARVAAITMKSQPYDDKAYFVNMVPWSTFFQAHNAIHGAYWHDRFGGVKSHGCINVAPLDARWVYEWLDPKVPAGWTSLRPVDLRESPTLHVHDEHRRPAFHQDRPIGPVDREDEAERLEEAEKRRVEQTAATPAPAAPGAATAPAAPPVPAAPAAPPAR